MTRIDAFKYEKFTIGVPSHPEPSKRTMEILGFTLRGLAIARIDTLASRLLEDFNLDYNLTERIGELWAGFLLSDGSMMPLVPVFRNLDAGALFISDVVNLLDWSNFRRGPGLHEESTIHAYTHALLNAKGLPFALLIEKDQAKQ